MDEKKNIPEVNEEQAKAVAGGFYPIVDGCPLSANLRNYENCLFSYKDQTPDCESCKEIRCTMTVKDPFACTSPYKGQLSICDNCGIYLTKK